MRRELHRRRATSGALAASVLIHLTLFAWFIHQAAPRFLAPAEVAEPDFTVELVPLPPSEVPPPPVERPAPRLPTARKKAPRPAPTRAPAPPSPAIQARPRPASRNAPSAPPAPPARATANIPAAGAPAGSARTPPRAQAPWAVAPDDGQDGVRSFLRATVGCSHEDYAHLTESERAACDKRLGREGREGSERVDALSAEARASFDAAVQARERMRAAGTGAMGSPVTACRGPGSNMDRGCLNPQGGVAPP